MITETRTYTIPLRDAYQEKPPQQKAPRAVKAIKSFLSKHMKTEEDSVKVSSTLNQVVWANGARNPPAKVTVVAEPRDTDVHVMTEDEYAEQPNEASLDKDEADDEDNEPDTEDHVDESSDESSDVSSDDKDNEDEADDTEES
jgi:large subunit ribosomal protein L31e